MKVKILKKNIECVKIQTLNDVCIPKKGGYYDKCQNSHG